MKFRIDREKYIDTGLVNEQSHPTAPLVIYNYSPKCQFSKAWDDVTKMCRGLIVNKETDEIVARPFGKFFNYDEHIQLGLPIPAYEPDVYTKLDGSLGILYWVDDKPFIATRGSFGSEQAKWATEWLKASRIDTSKFDRKLTYLFEIIYPANRIVVNYDFSALILIAIIDTETGKSLPQYLQFPEGLRKAKKHHFTSYDELKKLNAPNEEGFVLHFAADDIRVKIKFEDYVRLHKVMTGLSEIGIWEMLRDGKDPIADPEIPDEMHSWISSVVNRLKTRFIEIELEATATSREALKVTQSGDKKLDRKNVAAIITPSKHPGIAFAIYDGKDYKPDIWRMVRPKGSHTFRNDIDA